MVSGCPGINGLQFYDWQDEHDKPLAGTREEPAERWQDIAKRMCMPKRCLGILRRCTPET